MREEFEEKKKGRRHRTPKHLVALSMQQRERLIKIIEEPQDSYQEHRAKVILALDEGKFADSRRRPYDEIAKEIGVAKTTVARAAKHFCELGLELTLNPNSTAPPFSSEEAIKLRKLIEEAEEGEKWTVRKLATEFGRSQRTMMNALNHLRDESQDKLLTSLDR